MWKITWSAPYHVLSLDYLCLLTTNRLRLRIYCSAGCVIKYCLSLFVFLLYACATVVALEKLYSLWAMNPPLFINWVTCLKRLRTLGIESCYIRDKTRVVHIICLKRCHFFQIGRTGWIWTRYFAWHSSFITCVEQVTRLRTLSPTPAPTLLKWPSQEQRGSGLIASVPVLDVSAPACTNGVMSSSAACDCGTEEQTVDHVVLQCPIHWPPCGARDGFGWWSNRRLLNTWPEI